MTYIESADELLDALFIASEIFGLSNHDGVRMYCHLFDGWLSRG